MNETLQVALIGFGGSLVGAAAALVGTVLTLRHTEKAERDRRTEERVAEHERQLKQAYVAWLDSAHRLKNASIDLLHKVFDLNQQPVDLLQAVSNDPAFLGHHIEILEPDAEARRRLSHVVKTYGINTNAILHPGPELDRQKAVDEIAISIRDFRHWLVRTRFAPGYKVQSQPLANASSSPPTSTTSPKK